MFRNPLRCMYTLYDSFPVFFCKGQKSSMSCDLALLSCFPCLTEPRLELHEADCREAGENHIRSSCNDALLISVEGVAGFGSSYSGSNAETTAASKLMKTPFYWYV